MSSLNRVTLMGRLGKEPEIRRVQSGAAVANFSLATSESWKDKATGEKQEKTEWHNVVVWGNNDGGGLTSIIESYVHKGDLLFVEGQMQTRKWVDKDGNDRYSTEVVLKGPKAQLILMPKGSGAGGASNGAERDVTRAAAPAPKTAAPQRDDMDMEVPF